MSGLKTAADLIWDEIHGEKNSSHGFKVNTTAKELPDDFTRIPRKSELPPVIGSNDHLYMKSPVESTIITDETLSELDKKLDTLQASISNATNQSSRMPKMATIGLVAVAVIAGALYFVSGDDEKKGMGSIEVR